MCLCASHAGKLGKRANEELYCYVVKMHDMRGNMRIFVLQGDGARRYNI